MKITGFKKDADEEIMELSDIAIISSSKKVRELGKFLIEAANEMDDLGNDYDHIHLMDEWKNWKEGYPDIQVISEKYKKCM